MFVDINSNHWQKIDEIIKSEGLELYDLEFINDSTRVTIFSPNGVKSEDCTRVCKRLLVQASVEDLGFNAESHIEVNSPGINRRLRVLSHYESALEQDVKVLVNIEDVNTGDGDEDAEIPSELNGVLKGVLKNNVDKDSIVVEVVTKVITKVGKKKKKELIKKEWQIPLDAVKKARIDFRF